MNRRFKRMFDVVSASSALVLLAPVMGAVAIVIYLTMGRPVLFRHLRPGYKGVPFTLLKFRTMTDAQDARGELLSDELRLTAFGKMLRRLSLDELPQLWNVLRGDMSLVGPRPLHMHYLDRYTPEQARRHDVKPGITGWAQVQYKYGNTLEDAREKLQYDLFYIKNASVGLDFWIVFQTIKIVVLGRGAR